MSSQFVTWCGGKVGGGTDRVRFSGLAYFEGRLAGRLPRLYALLNESMRLILKDSTRYLMPDVSIKRYTIRTPTTR